MIKKRHKNRGQVNLQALLMSLGTFLSRILGFLRDLFIASFFSKTETDIFFVAFRFPNFFRRLLGEGTFIASVTPALTESLELQNLEETKKLHHSFFTLLFLVALLLSLLGVIFLPWLMTALFGNSAYASVEGKLEKTIVVGRLVFTYLFFVSLYSYFMSVAQAFGRFFLPAVAPAFFNLSLILFAWTPSSWWSFSPMALAWGVIVGGLLQLLPTLYEMRRLDLLPRFSLEKKKELKQLGKRLLPGMIGLSGLSCIGLINVYFAGSLEEGANSYIYYGDRLMEFPRALLAISIGSALVPEFTKQYSQNNLTQLKETLTYYLRFLLFLTLPFAVLFLIQSDLIVQLLFGRGKFDQESVIKTASILKIYTVVLVFSSLSRVLSSCFFALNKNWFMAVGAGFFVGFHFLFAFFLTPLYGLNGLVTATALSSVFFFLVLTSLLFYLIGSFKLRPLLELFFNIAPGLLAFALSLLLIPKLFYKLTCSSVFCESSSQLIPSSLSEFFMPLELSFISSHIFLSFILFSVSGLIGALLYISLSLFFKEQASYDFLKLIKKLINKK